MLTLTCINDISDWKDIDKETMIPYDLESYPLYLKTSSKLGSGDVFAVQLILDTLSHQDSPYTSAVVRLFLTQPPELTIEHCIENEKMNLTVANNP